MSVVEIIGVFVAIPAVIVAVLAAMTVGIGRHKATANYEPGQEWNFPDQLWAGDIPVIAAPPSDRVGTKLGGAHGNW